MDWDLLAAYMWTAGPTIPLVFWLMKIINMFGSSMFSMISVMLATAPCRLDVEHLVLDSS